jgi:hypothetical protein
MDLNVRASRTVQAALSELVLHAKRKMASRKGGLQGCPSRAKSGNAELRIETSEQSQVGSTTRRLRGCCFYF